VPCYADGHAEATTPSSANPMTGFLTRTLTIPREHPSYAGHFPGTPLLPGSALLALILSTLPAPCRRLDRVKLVSPTRPGEALRLEVAPGRQPTLLRFTCYRHDKTLVCSGEAQISSAKLS